MKFFVTILLMSLVSSAFASLSTGGQTGNGGNGCWVKQGPRTIWKSVEELVYPESFAEVTSFQQTLFFLNMVGKGEVRRVNFISKPGDTRFLKRFERIKFIAPHTFKALKETSTLLKISYVVNRSLDGHYAADITKLYSKCHKFSPAVMTFSDGVILFFKPTWDKLSPLTAEVILIHEILRLAQVLHPAFKDFTNTELQKLTALLFEEKRSYEVSKLLARIERRLETYDYLIPDTEENNTTQAFKSVLEDALREGHSWARKLNEFRLTNDEYNQAAVKNIQKLFRSTLND